MREITPSVFLPHTMPFDSSTLIESRVYDKDLLSSAPSLLARESLPTPWRRSQQSLSGMDISSWSLLFGREGS